MRYGVLGPLEVTDGTTVASLGPPKQRALLAVLLLHVGEHVPTDRLVDLLWAAAAPRTASHSIQIYVSALRRALQPLAGRDVIATHRSAYQLIAAPDEIDSVRFERLVADGTRALQRGFLSHAAATLEAALELWRGPALADFPDEGFSQPHIARLDGLRLDATESLAEARLASGQLHQAVQLIETSIRTDPFRERARELLMLTLYRQGRHPEALRAYQRFRNLLADELGLDPGPSLRRLQERILLHDPSLKPPAAPSTVHARNPFKGLRPFGEDDAGDFFGREMLVAQLVKRLRGGARLLALVGPSGSGKSSVVAAGLIPALRSGAVTGSTDWTVITAVSAGSQAQEPEELLAPGASEGQVVILDQFEELFTIEDGAYQRRFLDAITTAVVDAHRDVRVVVTLRADFYDRPLLHPVFAQVFTPAVVNVLPMTATELEEAVTAPAARIGVELERRLVTELIADTADQPGGLPLLQYALSELFDHRQGPLLTLADYREIGGVRGALSRRAEHLYAGLDGEQQHAVTQLFLRLVRLGRGTRDARRRLPLRELDGLDLDPVAVSAILERFGRHRLLSFDRDPHTDEGTIELAHESLLWEWERLSGWIDRHRGMLQRHEALLAALEEWETSGRHHDYLLHGKRLDEFAEWSKNEALELTRRERGFLDAGLERRQHEQEKATAQANLQRSLERRARRRLTALVAAVVLLGAATGFGLLRAGGAAPPPRAALLFHNAGSEFDEVIENGFDRAVADFGLTGSDHGVHDTEVASKLRELSEQGQDLIMELTVESHVDRLAPQFPDTRYLTWHAVGDRPNVAYFAWAEHEGSYLVGAAAALTTSTGTIGFLGGVDYSPIHRFEAGYEAGARRVRPDVRILSTYVTRPPSFEGFVDAELGEQAARGLYEAGADVVFHAASAAGLGAFEAAADMSGQARGHLWAIGVDTDQYETTQYLEGSLGAEDWRPHILTSMVKPIDVAIYDFLADYARGDFRPGRRELGLANGGIDISYSGGFIDHLRPQLEALRADIVAGEIQVPSVPTP
jgi:basic membrane lipoprotein Med (substrate-binding protein (PBP1-ABC) superfamily)/DNA-binding SARP family transcriptional activator